MLQLSCEFCTMKFPTLQTMFHHIKTTHVDRVNSPNTYIEHFNRFSGYGKYQSPYHTNGSSPTVDEHYKRKASEERVIIQQDHIKTEQSNASAGDLSDNEIDKRSSPASAVRSDSIKQEEEQDIPTDLSKKSISDEEIKSNPDTTCTPKPVQQPIGSFLCNQCNAALPDFESFRNHLKNHLSQSISSYVCQHCGTSLPNQTDYERHVYSHFLITNSEYCCNFNCNKAFTKSDDLQKHLLEMHAQSLFKCGICSDLFDTKVAIQVHFAVAHANEVKIYRCSACIEAFKSESEFRHHVKSRHSIPTGAVQCIFCRTVCASELEMHFHLAAHARQYRCPACPESFHVEFLLDRHMQTHHSTSQQAAPSQKEPMYHYKAATMNAAAPVTSATVNNNNILDYHYTTAAAAAAAATTASGNKSLYGFNNKFYNSLQVDTASSPNKTQMYGFYDALNKSRYDTRNDGNTNKNLIGMYNTELASKLYIGGDTSTMSERDLYPPQVPKSPYFSNSRSLVAAKSHQQDNGKTSAGFGQQIQQESENRENGYGCGICEKNDFTSEAEVHTHRKIAHNLKTGVSLRCAYCNGNFRSRYLLTCACDINLNTMFSFFFFTDTN